MKVAVYFNLHKHLFSIQALEGPYSGRVLLHVSKVYLSDVVFKVYESGRQRVLDQRRKNVHDADTKDPVHKCNRVEMVVNDGRPVIRMEK